MLSKIIKRTFSLKKTIGGPDITRPVFKPEDYGLEKDFILTDFTELKG